MEQHQWETTLKTPLKKEFRTRDFAKRVGLLKQHKIEYADSWISASNYAKRMREVNSTMNMRDIAKRTESGGFVPLYHLPNPLRKRIEEIMGEKWEQDPKFRKIIWNTFPEFRCIDVFVDHKLR